MKRFTITTLAALGILAGTVPAARAADTTCSPNNGGTISGTINGNLVVLADGVLGFTCTLQNVTVTGNVQVGKGASLSVFPGTGNTVTIGGNVQAAQCEKVSLAPMTGGAISVGGNVQIQYCGSSSGFAGAGDGTVTISGNFACNYNFGCFAQGGSVRGNVQVDNNSGRGAQVQSNVVGGNVQVNNNSGNFATGVERNTIGGNLRCAGNTPSVGGGGNTVTGNKQGQCAGL